MTMKGLLPNDYFAKSANIRKPFFEANFLRIAIWQQPHEVKTWDLSIEMADTYGLDFSVYHFDKACDVIDDYNETGGKNVVGGTGLASFN